MVRVPSLLCIFLINLIASLIRCNAPYNVKQDSTTQVILLDTFFINRVTIYPEMEFLKVQLVEVSDNLEISQT
jgi:hypothetical protein